MKKLLLPLIFAAILLCACSSRADTHIEQLKPPASVESPSTEAMQEITALITDSVADESVSTTSESATEASSQETVPTTELTTQSTTVSTTVPTTTPIVEPTTAKESAAPAETVPQQTESTLDTEGAIVYESGNNLVVSWDDCIMVIPGAADHIDEQFKDYIIYDRVYYINVSNDRTWNQYEYVAGEKLMEIVEVSDNSKLSELQDGTSSLLAVGTKIYNCENQPEMLLTLVDGELVPYYAMVEG